MIEGGERGSTAIAPPAEGEPWTVLHLVRWSAEYLKGKGVEGGRLDAEHLLADALRTDRLQLYLDFDRPLTAEELSRFRPGLLERARRKPLQYILGRAAFRDLNLRVDPRVLIPRPETEELVEAVLQWARGTERMDLRALDIGTGSGAIALSLALEGPFAQVVATDASKGALDVARLNAQLCGLSERVEFRAGSDFDPIREEERFDLLVSNPPYVSEAEYAGLAPELREWEPKEALVSEAEGLAAAFAILAGAARVLSPGGLLALEVGAGQAGAVAARIREAGGFDAPRVLRDLSRRERFVLATRAGAGGEGSGAIVESVAEAG